MASAVKKAAPQPARPANQGSDASVAQRSATRTSNSSLAIDFSTSREADSFSATGRQSTWVLKLNGLAEACADPDCPAEYGKFYQIGTFSTASTAQSTRKRIEDEHAGQLVGIFELRSERTADGSALYAAAFADDEPKNKPVTGDDGDDWNTDS